MLAPREGTSRRRDLHTEAQNTVLLQLLQDHEFVFKSVSLGLAFLIVSASGRT